MATDDRSKNEWRSQSLVWWIGAAAVCLGFLLLTVILGLVAHNTSAFCLQIGKMKCENLIYNLTKDKEILRDERDQLRINSSTLTKEMEVLQSQYNTVAASRDQLQEEVMRLNLSRAAKPCHQGWTKFNNKCYFISANGVTKTWEESRKDCQERRADLVIITTKTELDFVTKSYSLNWVGLSDKVQEGKWKWVDGTDLVGPGFWINGEPNDAGGNEDCVEVVRGSGWNDAICDRKLPWVCED